MKSQAKLIEKSENPDQEKLRVATQRGTTGVVMSKETFKKMKKEGVIE